MIKKIISIKGVGRFVNYDGGGRGDIEFRKTTLIFSENGRGKTMLTNIFRSLRTQDKRYIMARRALWTADEPQVCLRLEGTNAKFKNGSWDSSWSDVEIFDSTFVNNNVCSGCHVNHEQKKGLYRFVIGEQGFQLAHRIDELDNLIKTKNSEMNIKEREIQRHIIGKFTVQQFFDLPQESDIEKEIGVKLNEIEAIKRVQEIANKSTLSILSLPTLPIDELKKLLSKRLEDISEDAERKTKEHIARCMDQKGEKWLSHGLNYVKDDFCPFCGQSLKGIELIAAYRSYFDAAYVAFKAEIGAFSDMIKKLLSQDKILAVQKIIETNKSLTEFWNRYVQAAYPEGNFTEIEKSWNEVRGQMDKLLERKAASPLEIIELDAPFKLAVQNYETILKKCIAYNQIVETVNVLINEKKHVTKVENLSTAERELERLKNIKLRFEPNVDKLCAEYKKITEEKKELEIEKQNTKIALNNYDKDILKKYEIGMNRYLENFGAGFKIVDVEKTYIGVKPNLNYCISINNKTVDLGDEKAQEENPCFKNTLSDGDKSTLAFAFFLARLDQDHDLAKKTVIFDDPISSLDSHRKGCTCQEIARIGRLAKQVVVLSHDQYFLRMIWAPPADQARIRTLKIDRSGKEESTIVEWDIERETRGEYFRNYFTLTEYLENGPNGDLKAVASCIRPLLEGNLRLRFPKEFNSIRSNEWLGNFLDKIRTASVGDNLYCLKPYLQELSDINDYSKKYHHQIPDANVEPPKDAELQSYVKRTLNAITGVL